MLASTLSPSAHGVKIEWSGADAVWHELVKGGDPVIPVSGLWSTEVSRVNGEVLGVYKTELPEPTGTIIAYWYPADAADPVLEDFLTGAISTPGATNASARPGVHVQSAIICANVRFTVDTGVSGAPVTRYTMTAVEFQRDAASVTPGATGTPITYTITVHGEITKTEV